MRSKASLSVVTLWRPGWSATQDQVMAWLREEHFPRGTCFIWAFDPRAATLGNLERGKITFSFTSAPDITWLPHQQSPSPTEWQKHLLIADLYTQVIQKVESEALLLVEDDVVPKPGDFLKLQETLDKAGHWTAGVSGLYRSRKKPHCACASSGGSYLEWKDVAGRQNLQPIAVDWFGGGVALYRTQVVQQALPLLPSQHGGAIQGWDKVLCGKLRQQGFSLFLDPRVEAAHVCTEVLRWCEREGGRAKR